MLCRFGSVSLRVRIKIFEHMENCHIRHSIDHFVFHISHYNVHQIL